MATFCGRETTDTEQAPGQQVILSPGPYMGLTFRSDFSNEERFTGFDAHYTAVGKQHLNLQDQLAGIGNQICRDHIPGQPWAPWQEKNSYAALGA